MLAYELTKLDNDELNHVREADCEDLSDILAAAGLRRNADYSSEWLEGWPGWSEIRYYLAERDEIRIAIRAEEEE